MTDERTLTFTQAAKVANIAPRNLQRWIFGGKLKATKPDGVHWAIQERDLLEALQENPAVKKSATRGRARPGIRPGCRLAARPDDAPESPASTEKA